MKDMAATLPKKTITKGMIKMKMEGYKYNPDNFNGIMRLSDDLKRLYQLYEIYKNKKTRSNKFALENCGEDIFFTLKHRKLEGIITHDTANDILAYVRELIYD